MSVGIKIFAPASVANLACGYDILGLAFNGPGDEIIARPSDKPGVHISMIRGDQKKLPRDPLKNTAGFAALKLLEHLGTDKGVDLEINKKMPFGSGLGSSAASAAGAVVATNAMLGKPLTREELLPFAVLGEQIADGAYHADNVAPALFGGIVLIRDNESLDIVKLPCPKGLYVTVVHPKLEILTSDARSILAEEISLKSHIKQSGNLAAFISALYTSDFKLIKRSLQDVIVEPQRASLIPGFYDVKKAALDQGALACSISGAGPSIFAFAQNSLFAENIAEAMKGAFRKNHINSESFVSSINTQGVKIY